MKSMGRLSETERQAEIFKRSFEGLCKFGKYPDYFEYGVEPRSNFMRVGWDSKHLNRLVAISFPRKINMRSLYPDIRAWFDSHDIEWKNYTRSGHKFMIGYVDNDPIKLQELVEDAGRKVFRSQNMELMDWNSQHLYDKSTFSRFYYLTVIVIVFCLLNIAGFFLYEILHIFKLSVPSLNKIDLIELGLLIGIYGGPQLLGLLLMKPRVSTPWKMSRRRRQLYKTMLFSSFILIAASTA